ncbi:MAG: hypothetical protein WBQ55_19125 [Xanthobacteraceae bacterium]
MEHGAEIDRLDRELANLRARLEIYRQSVSILRRFFTLVIPAAVLVLAILLFLHDALEDVFFAGMVLVVGVLIAVVFKNSDLQWIDFAAAPFANGFVDRMYRPGFFYPDAFAKPRNDVELLEIQIAERERRLSELRSL